MNLLKQTVTQMPDDIYSRFNRYHVILALFCGKRKMFLSWPESAPMGKVRPATEKGSTSQKTHNTCLFAFHSGDERGCEGRDFRSSFSISTLLFTTWTLGSTTETSEDIILPTPRLSCFRHYNQLWDHVTHVYELTSKRS